MQQQAMARDWESTLRSWAAPPSQTERDKCDNAVRMIRAAIDNHPKLSEMPVRVFGQGSYRANTNVAQDSDVDVTVCYEGAFFYKLPMETSKLADFSLVPSTSSYADFKDMVGNALVDAFGRTGVTRGNKAFDLHENTYRIDADVVAAYEHRRYTGFSAAGEPQYISGVEFRPASGASIINWPEQTYDNGVAKNNRTGRRYKAAVRAVKRLRNEMQGEGVAAAKDMPSFLIESLLWNVADANFEHDAYVDVMRAALASAFNDTIKDETCSDWGEVNELKYLFRASQPWTREQAHSFLSAAWDYIGYR